MQYINKDLFCNDLPTRPLRSIGTILVTGASGYIGGRLVPELCARGYRVRVMVRAVSPAYRTLWPKVEITVADALDQEQLDAALKGIHTAYYLIHSLYLGPREFESADIKAAVHFRKAAQKNHVKRIIYLGGLGDIRNPLSSHLRSRIEVARELKSGTVPTTILRAAIIIGSGSASYELIKHLVRKLPLMVIPRWAKNLCQPIAIRDVIKYLVGVLEVPKTAHQHFDIGGTSILTYAEMLKIQSRIIGKKTLFIPCFFSNIPLYAYVASLLTPIPNAITQCLMQGLKNEVICHDDCIKKYLLFKPITYKEALVGAMSREEQDQVYTRWSDAYPPAHEFALKLHEIDPHKMFRKHYSLLTAKSSSPLFHSICRIGGREGWFHNNWLWRLRGLIDRVMLGVGMQRGRKSDVHLAVNDVIDFWRIEDLQRNQRLLLRAEMKLPGRAWLEFRIAEHKNRRKLTVTAYFNTTTAFGKAYWYACLPFHHIIFKKLIEEIEKRSYPFFNQ